MAPFPHVTIIVPARNEEKNLKACLKALKALKYPSFEITVVDNGSSDNTAIIARDLQVSLIHEPIQGRGKARNTGMRKSSSDWLAFVDADCIVDPDWLLQLMKETLKVKASVAQGPILPASHNEDSLQAFRLFRLAQRTNGSMSFLTVLNRNSPLLNGAAFLVAREAMLDVGGFDETLVRHQDIDLGKRLFYKGYDFLFNPEAKAKVYFSGNWITYLKRSFEVGFYKKLYNKKWSIPTALPSAIFLNSKKYFKMFLKTKNANWLWLLIDEVLIYLGEYIAHDSESRSFACVVNGPHYIITRDEILLTSRVSKWIKVDRITGQIFRMISGRISKEELQLDTEVDLSEYEEKYRELVK